LIDPKTLFNMVNWVRGRSEGVGVRMNKPDNGTSLPVRCRAWMIGECCRMLTNVYGCFQMLTFRTCLNGKIANNYNELYVYFGGRTEPARLLLHERLYHPRNSLTLTSSFPPSRE
jgi:hypothetical protein